MGESKGYADAGYLRTTAELLRPVKQRSYTLMQIQSGHKVLDLGCGPGTDTVALARLVGPYGQVVGLDHDAAMLAQADQQARQAQVAAWVLHGQADASSLPFGSGHFDSSRSERLFQHLHDPERALAEMIRVTRSGGRIVVVDTDWGTLSIDSPEIEIERRLARVGAERLLHNGYSGRHLYHLFKRHGLADIQVVMYPIFVTDYALGRQLTFLDETEAEALTEGIVSHQELERWHAGLAQTEAEGGFFCTVSVIIVAGRTH